MNAFYLKLVFPFSKNYMQASKFSIITGCKLFLLIVSEVFMYLFDTSLEFICSIQSQTRYFSIDLLNIYIYLKLIELQINNKFNLLADLSHSKLCFQLDTIPSSTFLCIKRFVPLQRKPTHVRIAQNHCKINSISSIILHYKIVEL